MLDAPRDAWDAPRELVPSARIPLWRRVVVALLLGVPTIVLLAADFARYAGADEQTEPWTMSGWTGLAFCALWLAVLVRTIPPLARSAGRLEAAATTVVGVAVVQGLALPLPWLTIAAACGIAVLALRRPVRRTVAPRDRVDRAPDVEGRTAFSETSADPIRAGFVAVGCALFAAAGIVMTIMAGAQGWWYLLASAVWLTGAVPWMLRVTLDHRVFVVRTLLLPRAALVRVPLEDVVDVEAGTVRPRRWGGVGCVVEGGVTSVLRAAGGAVLVTRTDGSQIVVNVERPDEAVATFAALRASRDA